MANTLKLRGGTTAEVAAATLAEREIMVDTTKDVIVVGPTKKEMAVGNGGTYTRETIRFLVMLLLVGLRHLAALLMPIVYVYRT